MFFKVLPIPTGMLPETSAIIASLQTYYGLDWLSFLFGLVGMWMLTKKQTFGFFFMAVSIVMAGIVAGIAAQYGFIIANTFQFIIALKAS